MALNMMKKADETILGLFGIQPSPYALWQVRGVFIATALTLVFGSAIWGYRLYSINRERNAQKTLSECIEQYQRAAAGGKGTMWSTVEMACKLGHDQHAGSTLAPYFLAYHVDALLAQNKKDEALTIMQDMMRSLSTSSPLYYLYATKQSLMQMDAADAAVQQAGLQRLEQLAADANNIQKDMALYYLGAYHWYNDNRDAAKDAWQKIVTLPSDSEEHASPWATFVKERLKTVA